MLPKVIEKNEASEFLSIGELWQRIVGKNELWREIEEGGAPVEVTIDAVDVLHEQFTLLHDGGRFPIRSIEFDAILQAKVPQMPLAEAAVYSSADGKEVFARLGTWKGSEKDVVKGLTFIGYVKKTERQS